MKHGNKTRTLGRTRDARVALLRSLARNLIMRGSMITTITRAKELRRLAERLVTIGRKNTLASRRIIRARLGGDTEATNKMMKDVAPRYTERPGGYTRITKLSVRLSDGSQRARIEFI